ncbi:MAG: large conductance mechanosensitive channel protein MscL [Lachnospiraceae bacterium]|nr:large conductance mechanosensitive channel protein MscL [Lachnospiraceae bacterium]
MKKLIGEFKDFVSKGNVLDMAVGIIIGGAFTAIVNSLVGDIINPLINTILGGISFAALNITVKAPWIKFLNENVDFFRRNPIEYPVLGFGNFIAAIITFFITALALFILIKSINKASNLAKKKKADEEAAAPTTKICPYCKSEINIEATKCPHCTSDQPKAEA